MIAKETRQNSRRLTERRSENRRQITAQFNSTEWLKSVQQEYLLWPKQNRRRLDRRTEDRRQGTRRIQNIARTSSTVRSKNVQGLLTDEEIRMLNDLFRSDSIN